jgi:AcrR family transcriptional regulator
MGPTSSTGSTVRSSVDGRAARWSGHRERRREEFVDAALDTIASYGPQTSTEQIADRVGVTRTKLYRYFDGAADLQRSVAQRVSEMLGTEYQRWKPTGSPMEMAITGVSLHVRWLIDHPNLYRYLVWHSMAGDAGGVRAIDDIKATLGAGLSRVLAAYFSAFGLDTYPAQSLGFGLVGFVESAAIRWLDDPAALPHDEFIKQLAGWCWLLVDNVLRAGGIDLDPHQPLARASQITRPGTDSGQDEVTKPQVQR